MSLAGIDLVVIKNVDNLVSPAKLDVGQHAQAMIYSVTDGEKNRSVFRVCKVKVVIKTDFLPLLDRDRFYSSFETANPQATIIPTSAQAPSPSSPIETAPKRGGKSAHSKWRERAMTVLGH